MSVEVHTVGADRWADLADLFGPSGAYSGCWCMWWRIPGGEFSRNGNAGNRAALERIVAGGEPVGLLGYRAGRPVGWVALAPRAAYTRLLRSPALKPEPGAGDDADVWSVPCFFTHRGERGGGVAEALLAGALDAARASGARDVEGYPVDTASHRPPAAELFTGTVGLFERAGFAVVRRPATGRRLVMRRATG